jgi:hypothetical protein
MDEHAEAVVDKPGRVAWGWRWLKHSWDHLSNERLDRVDYTAMFPLTHSRPTSAIGVLEQSAERSSDRAQSAQPFREML